MNKLLAFFLTLLFSCSFLIGESVTHIYEKPWNFLITENTKVTTVHGIKMRAWDLKSISQSQTFNTVLRLIKKESEESIFTDDLAFWINMYNIASLKLILEHYPIEVLSELGSLDTAHATPLLNIAGTYYSLDDIATLLYDFNDPRILFALSEGTVSSPSIYHESFTTQWINQQLDFQTISFLTNTNAGVNIKNNGKEVHVSHLFKNAQFFKSNPDIITFINDNTEYNLETPSLFYLPFKETICEY